MKKKPYIIPATTLCHFNATESIADEVIISTSNATVIGGGEGGGDLNAKEGFLTDDEPYEDYEEVTYEPFQSLWEERLLTK